MYVTSTHPFPSSFWQRHLTMHPNSRTSLCKTATLSHTQKNHCCITRTCHGKRKTPATYLMWRWARMMEPRHANPLAPTCCPSSNWNVKAKLVSTVKMVWQYAKQHLNKSRKRNNKSVKFSSQMASKSPSKQTKNHKCPRHNPGPYKWISQTLHETQQRNPLCPPTKQSPTCTTEEHPWKTSTNDWQASHLARKFLMTRFHHTRKRLMRVATITSSHINHSQSAKEITKEKSYGTTPMES